MIGCIPLACKPIETLSWQFGLKVVMLRVKGILLSRVNLNIMMIEALLFGIVMSLITSPAFRVTKLATPLIIGSLISVMLTLTLALTALFPLYTAM